MYPYKTTFQPVGDAPNISQPTENQWSNPSNFQVDLDTVDWAALAQQWITMKETSTHVIAEQQFVAMPMAPPPPTISKPIQHDLGEEQGEAPMEVEHDEEEHAPPAPAIVNNNVYAVPPAPVNVFAGNQSNNGTSASAPSTQSNWSNSKSMESKPWHKKGSRRNHSHGGRSHDSKNYRQPQTFRGDPYNTISPQAYNLKSNDTHWQMANQTGGGLTSTNASHTHADATAASHTDSNQFKSGTQLDNVDLMPSTLDAAQRKTLPAWIREGLEKMERGKQRDADRIREAKERDEKQRQIRLAESKVISLNPGIVADDIDATAAPLLLKSKFESDSDDDSDSEVDDVDHRRSAGGGDDDDDGGDDDGAKISESKKSVADAYAIAKAGSSKASAIVSKPHRSKADILQDIMLSVRKNLTEILLEVTNEQIHEIANETLSKMRSKGLKAQTVQKNALTAITGGLGLVTYDDSDGSKSSSESEDDEPSQSSKSRNDLDSDDELMNTIERRKIAFEMKSAEIEEYLAQNDEKEKKWLEKDDGGSERAESPDDRANDAPSASSGRLQNIRTESGEIQQDKNKITSASGRKTDRRSSRFSDAKGLVYNVANSMAAVSPTTVGKPTMSSVDLSKDSENSSDSFKKSSHAPKSHHSSKHEHSDRRHRSSSSERSHYSRRKHSRRDRSHSRPRHRSRSRSPSTDRASKSSKSSRTARDTYSKEPSYNRSYSYRSSRRKRSHSRSRSRSYDSRSSHHRHR